MHQRRRKQLEPLGRSGALNYARCGRRIQPNEPWALDHTDDRTGYLGASHATCNLQAAAHKTNGKRRDYYPSAAAGHDAGSTPPTPEPSSTGNGPSTLRRTRMEDVSKRDLAL